MKILFISPTYSGVGGIGPHAFRLSQKLREEGYDIELMKVPHIPIKNLKNSFEPVEILEQIPKPINQNTFFKLNKFLSFTSILVIFITFYFLFIFFIQFICFF